jgi:hypothetical protein
MKLSMNLNDVTEMVELYLKEYTKFTGEVCVRTSEEGIDVYIDEVPADEPVVQPEQLELPMGEKPKVKRGRKPKQPVEVVEVEEEPVVVTEPVKDTVEIQELIEEVHQEMIEEATFDEDEMIESMVTEPSSPLFADEEVFDPSKPLFG